MRLKETTAINDNWLGINGTKSNCKKTSCLWPCKAYTWKVLIVSLICLPLKNKNTFNFNSHKFPLFYLQLNKNLWVVLYVSPALFEVPHHLRR